MNELDTELADNAPTDGCSITPTAVSPRVQHVTEQGNSPVITLTPGICSESTWESMEPISKRAIIKESENEVIEILARGHGKRVSRRSVQRTTDPRPTNSEDEDFNLHKDEFIGKVKTDDEVSEGELRDAQAEAKAHRDD